MIKMNEIQEDLCPYPSEFTQKIHKYFIVDVSIYEDVVFSTRFKKRFRLHLLSECRDCGYRTEITKSIM
jgi:hypothetical protein